jgi:predicted dehydrogenase
MNIRFGIIGTGFMAGQHAKNLKNIEGVEVSAVAGLTHGDAAAFIAQQGLAAARPFAGGASLVAEAALDALVVCMPPFAHQGEVEAAAARGLHVFLEKPIAIDSQHARAMVEAIERAGVVSQVGFMMRFGKAARFLKEKLDSGEAGRPTLFTGRFWVNMDGSPWWRDHKRSGGQVFEQIIHLYDLARAFCGDVADASGHLANLLHTQQPDYSIEDTSAGLLRFKNGTLGVITGSNCAVPMHFIADYRVVCEHGTLDVHCAGQPWVTPDQAHWMPVHGSPVAFADDNDKFRDEMIHFVHAIRNQTPTLCPAREGLAAIELVEQIIHA